MIPFSPQPFQVLKERFYKCLIQSWNVENVSKNPNERPGNQQQYVFDFEDGIRLIVSRDHYKGKEVIHVSASVDHKLYDMARASTLLTDMYHKFMGLSGIKTPPEHFFFSEKGVPHWLIEFMDLN